MKKIRSKVGLILLPVLLWLAHNYLATKYAVVENRGISFGVSLPLVEVFLVVFLAIMLAQALKNFRWSIFLVLVGGLMNFADRLLFGFVRDYFKVIFFYNNLADWVIFVGVILYLVNFFDETNKHNI